MEYPAYPLVLGVSGHRNIADSSAIQTQIRSFLRHLSETLTAASYPARVEYTILSSLAKGADRIVASTAIEELNASLQMVSPLPLDEYRKDFVDKSDREEFETLLKHDSHPTILNETTKNDWLNSEHRNQAYLDAGKKVVDLCEILIVVWDGLPARGKGGTGDIVEYALNQQRMTIWLDPNNPQQQPKLLVPDMESNNPLPGMKTSTLPEQIKYWSLGYHRYRAFVADPVVDKLTIERHCESTLGELETAGVDSGFPSQWSSYARGIATIMSQADLMAVAYQKKYLFAAKALYRLSAIAVTIAVFQILFYPQQIWMISFEIAAMLAAAGLFLYSRREAWHEKWLNDRYIAESLRSTIYHDLAIGKSKIATEPSNALPFYIGPDHWFFSAFRKILEQFPESMPKLDFKARKHFLIKHWIKSQANWHAVNAARKEKIVRKYEIFGFTCFCLTVVMAILHLIGIGHDAHATESDHKAAVVSNHHEEKTGQHHAVPDNSLGKIGLWISFFAVVFPAWGAASHAIISLLEYERIARRSEKMSDLLNEIANQAERCQSDAELSHCINKAREIMELENQEWHISLSFRELQLPA